MGTLNWYQSALTAACHFTDSLSVCVFLSVSLARAHSQLSVILNTNNHMNVVTFHSVMRNRPRLKLKCEKLGSAPQ